ERPESSARVLANMPNGAKVTVYGEWQGWYTVHYEGLVGYAAAAYIDT
ncbi:MAG: SH3 domain-containing protein, partial [Oscillibacter sp.]|nr:SH3 domain-containing protein [Oscillibacter sp.]